MLLSLLAQLAVATPTVAAAHAPDAPTRSVQATQATRAPVIDGRSDDGIWTSAPRMSEFRQYQPNIDIAPSMKTEFQVAYDSRNLCVFIRMFDPHPDSIMHALSRRDVRGPSDQVKVVIDSCDDKRTGFELAVNPDGVKRGYAICNDGDEDASWNGIWDVATRVDAEGWTAEFRIPRCMEVAWNLTQSVCDRARVNALSGDARRRTSHSNSTVTRSSQRARTRMCGS